LKEYKDIYRKNYASAQIIIPLALHPRVFQVSLFIFFTTRKVYHGCVLITYTIDGEVNHNQCSPHNRGKS
jgi:hypothetical protein